MRGFQNFSRKESNYIKDTYVSDLTMCMSIQPNPGWDSATATNSKHTDGESTSLEIKFSRQSAFN